MALVRWFCDNEGKATELNEEDDCCSAGEEHDCPEEHIACGWFQVEECMDAYRTEKEKLAQRIRELEKQLAEANWKLRNCQIQKWKYLGKEREP